MKIDHQMHCNVLHPNEETGICDCNYNDRLSIVTQIQELQTLSHQYKEAIEMSQKFNTAESHMKVLAIEHQLKAKGHPMLLATIMLEYVDNDL